MSGRDCAPTILVTGGAGFLGSHLCEHLLGSSAKVLCLDNLSTGRRANIAHLIDNPRFELLMQDVQVPVHVHRIERIYNFASPASPLHYQRNPVATTLANVQGALNMLEVARRTGARILQASTSEVYGDAETQPQQESYWGNVNPIGPRACYDEGKRCAETLFFDYRRQYSTQIKVVRIFNTYGPRMQPFDGRVVPSFICSALRGEPLRIFGRGNQTRCFCYVDDLIDGIARFMDSDEQVTGPMNIGSDAEVTIADLAEIIIDLTGTSSKVTTSAPVADDPRRRRPDLRQATAAIGWQPGTPLRVGLLRTIEYFEGLLRCNRTVQRLERGSLRAQPVC